MKLSLRALFATTGIMVCGLGFVLPLPALAADQTVLMKKIESLSQQLDELKKQMQELRQQESSKDEWVAKVEKKAQDAEKKVQIVEKKTHEAAKSSALEISGDYRFRVDRLKGETPAYYNFNDVLPWMLGRMVGAPPAVRPAQEYRNNSLLTNRLGLNLKAKATEDIAVKARLVMYKGWGEETYASSPFFADRFYSFDGNAGHTPQDNILRVDQAYATWSGIGGAPVWFSVGRRPSTGGIPTNLRQNIEKNSSDTAGVPGLLVDYAFDGATVGVAPDISMLPGAYAKFCYGRGFESGFTPATSSVNTLKDVHFVGVNLVPYATDNLRVELQWDRGYNIFAFPESETLFALPGFHNANLGNIDQYMIGVSGKVENLGPGDLNLFASSGMSKTHPNGNQLTFNAGTAAAPVMVPIAGLMYDGLVPTSTTGTAFYLGGRYDIKSMGTKLGLEYNHGSKNWVSFAPASDDMWTAKQGVHGNVYEAYLIHEINSRPVSKFGKAQFRLGYQYYDFKYTGSNNWVGAPRNIADLALTPANAQMLIPLKNARNIYLTFDVAF
ncbi:DNA-binding protein H-NS [Gammaproteobacteria bacterium]